MTDDVMHRCNIRCASLMSCSKCRNRQCACANGDTYQRPAANRSDEWFANGIPHQRKQYTMSYARLMVNTRALIVSGRDCNSQLLVMHTATSSLAKWYIWWSTKDVSLAVLREWWRPLALVKYGVRWLAAIAIKVSLNEHGSCTVSDGSRIAFATNA